MKGHHQAFPPPSGLRFLTDYEQYMDFSHYMGKGLQQQGDSSTHFKDLSGALGPRFQVFFSDLRKTGGCGKKQITRSEQFQRCGS